MFKNPLSEVHLLSPVIIAVQSLLQESHNGMFCEKENEENVSPHQQILEMKMVNKKKLMIIRTVPLESDLERESFTRKE